MSVTTQELIGGIRQVLREQLGWEGALGPDTRLIEDLELDSVRQLTLVVGLEDWFEVCLEEGDEEGVETVADLVEVLRRRLAS
jgi:acyl carrier protein